VEVSKIGNHLSSWRAIYYK